MQHAIALLALAWTLDTAPRQDVHRVADGVYAVVWLPQDRVVATGDVVVAPIPFAFNAFVGGWVAVLDSIGALRPPR